MSRTFLTKLHLIVAAFMFPAILMFLVTGALYTWGNKGEWVEETVTVALDAPLTADEAALKAVVQGELDKRGLPVPSGSASVSEAGEPVSLQWTGAKSEASVKATDDPLVAEVTVKEATLHRNLVQLHKAKGSDLFKVYATFLAFVLFLLVASGLVLGLQVKALRRLTVLSSVAGAVAFVGFVALG
ncbi:MAG: PepSY domain-containing protein [Sphingomonadaceae bacterium]|nr:PepSY domain-containing protein [Sphingomonadaceae bacterium]